jgi:hypothetical protein
LASMSPRSGLRPVSAWSQGALRFSKKARIPSWASEASIF